MVNKLMDQIVHLRSITGVGFMKCKEVLKETDGDIDKAISILRASGVKNVKTGDTGTGFIYAKCNDDNTFGIIIRISSDTDFVAKNETLFQLVDKYSQKILDDTLQIESLDGLLSTKIDGKSFSDELSLISLSLRESLLISDYQILKGEYTYSYLHKTNSDLPAQIGVLLLLDKKVNEDIAKGICQHVIVNTPVYKDINSIDQVWFNNERKIIEEELKDILYGKDDKIKENIIKGKVNSLYKRSVLFEQEYIHDNKISIKEFLKKNNVNLLKCIYFKIASKSISL